MKALFYVILLSLWTAFVNLACAEPPPAASADGHYPAGLIPNSSNYKQRLENAADVLVALNQVPDEHPSGRKTPAAGDILTADEQAWVAAHAVVSIGYSNNLAPIVIVDSQGRHSGVLMDYLPLLEQRTGLKFRLRLGSFNEVINDAYRHKLDMLGPVYMDDQHRKHLILSRPILRSHPYIYVRSDVAGGIVRLSDLAHKRVGYIAGQRLFDRIFTEHPNMVPAPLKDNQQLATALITGEVDAVLAPMTFEYWRKQQTHTGFKVAAPVTEYGGDVALGVRNDSPVLARIIDKGLESITASERQAILNRWFGAEALQHEKSSRPDLSLTREELAWLEAHPIIKAGIDPLWAPIEFFGESGVPQGISMTYLSLFEKMLGVKFDVAKTRSWSMAQAQLREGSIDLLPAVSETPRRSELYRFTTPYLSIPISIFSAENVAYLGSLELLAGKKVAVVKGYAIEEWLQRDHPELDLVSAPTVKDALRQVARGEAFAFVGNLITTSYNIGQSGLIQIHVAGETPYKNELGMAVHKNAAMLQGILQKALNAVPRAQRDKFYNNWISIQHQHGQDYSLLWKIVLLGALILAIVLFWARRLSLEVAHRRQVEMHLKKAKDEAEKANQVKSEFLANMSHEIRTPMNAIIGSGHLLGQTALAPQQSEYLKAIQSSSKILLDLIDNMLDISRIEAGKIELRSAQFSLRKIMQDLVLQLRESTREKGLTFSVEVDDHVPRYMVGDAQRLLQILLNLAGNAVKFTASGAVNLRALVVDKGGDQNKVRIKFTVADTGPGIEQEQREAIFKPFFQADSSLTRQQGGSGLGLAISQAFAHKMGSNISLESSPGKGSIFSFEVAFSASQHQAEKQKSSLPAAVAKGLRILLVEDDALNQKIATALLENLAASVSVANNGRSALDALQSGHFDLVFMDLQMPGMDGYEAVSKIRKNPAWRDLPVIAMTAHALEKERENCLGAGMNDYLTKPVDPDALALIIMRWSRNPENEDAPLTPADGENEDTENTFSSDQSQPHSLQQRLSEFYGMLGNERGSALLEETLRFLNQSTSELGTALKNRDWSTASKLAHKMKGALFVCGDAELEALLDRVESLPSKADSPDKLLTTILAKVEALTKTSQQWEKKAMQSREIGAR
ncbi:MAG: transporter substrate-binding domain-containing protein [Thiotrichales bacterium]